MNLKGELVGINSDIATQNGGFIGSGFVIPVNLVKKFMSGIIETGKLTRGRLWVDIQNILAKLATAMKLDVAKVVILNKLIEDSPTGMVSITEESVILQLNGKDIDNGVKRTMLVASHSSKSDLAEKILRKGKPMDLTIKLGELTANVQ